MRLDVVLPTYNRAPLLSKTLKSLTAARCPQDLRLTVVVVDNNSRDNTRETVATYRDRLSSLKYVIEKQQGLSAALNSGILAGDGDFIALLNDDEEVDIAWLEVIHRFFRDTDFDFAGGPYKPNWSIEKPAWISKEFGSIVGWVDAGNEAQTFGPGFNAMLMGGNAVFRRSVFEKVGLYDTSLGRSDKGLLSCEDEEMFGRLMAANLKGRYLPDLIIYHYIPPDRLTRSYHRRWCWGHGISSGLLSRTRASGAKEFFGIPRWKIRQAGTSLLGAARGVLRLQDQATAFADELHLWDLAGYLNGRFFRRTPLKHPRSYLKTQQLKKAS